NTDSNGNYVSNAISGVSGKSIALESFETSFHQDLNGDGTIGVVGTTIESSGSTSLVQVGNSYGLFTGGSGPSLKYGGTEFTAGQFGCVVVGAEAVGSGYQVVLKVAGADTYAVWNTDSNGNYVSNAISGVSGKSIALESFETSFHQDLNGDGTIGVVAHQNDFHLL
ncbi:MAG: hypothetical protein J0H42_33985, partial [Rhizobiales bacterium]|nr:hypothetical protein [Hyphomicrobiales bacterium]